MKDPPLKKEEEEEEEKKRRKEEKIEKKRRKIRVQFLEKLSKNSKRIPSLLTRKILRLNIIEGEGSAIKKEEEEEEEEEEEKIAKVQFILSKNLFKKS